jgi:hypothetical protein
VLTFDEDHVLRDYKVLKNDDGMDLYTPLSTGSPVPRELQPTGAAPPDGTVAEPDR